VTSQRNKGFSATPVQMHSVPRLQVWVASLVTVLAIMFTASLAHAKAAPESFANLAEKLLPTVVNISTTQLVEGGNAPQLPQLPPGSPFKDFFEEFFDRNGQGQGQGQENGHGRPDRPKRKATSLGSGFIIDTKTNGDSYVITNNHVISDADEITVILHDNTRLTAELVGRDAKTDLAVLKVKSDKKMAKVKFGDSTKSRVGDWVVAIGNPFGLGGTVTAGIISARGRDIHSGPYDNFIQTDASINRGNSGGPMFNMDGEVIGINTAIYSPSGGSVGIGFAIPSSGAEPVINQLIKHGEVKRGWLGVHIQAVTDEIAETLNLKKAEGALVASLIKGGPAEAAGIKVGDVIIEFDGKPVPKMRKLPRIVAETDIDKPVTVVVWRDGRKVSLKVDVGRLDETEEVVASNDEENEKKTDKTDKMVSSLGLTLAELTPSLRQSYKLDEEARGVVVTDVKAGSAAQEKGIREGDLVVEVSQEEVTTPTQVIDRVEAARKEKRKRVLMLIEGQAGLRFIALEIEDE
jgi:serine protease Do